jgi:hypothetical protein
MPPSFLVLSEDGSHDAVPSLVALTKRMCQLVVPALRTHLLRFEPPEPRLRRSLTANKWKSQSAADQFLRTELVRTIATHLLRPDGFVIFHFDGDTPYRDRAASTNAAQFGPQIVTRVTQLLRGQRPDDEAARLVQKLIAYVPHYCVEAWTYYNLPVLEELCRAQSGGRDDPVLATWKAAPAEIEEVEQPWRLVSAGKAHNRTLAERAYPADVALDAGKSFHATVFALLDNSQLVAALEALA